MKKMFCIALLMQAFILHAQVVDSVPKPKSMHHGSRNAAVEGEVKKAADTNCCCEPAPPMSCLDGQEEQVPVQVLVDFKARKIALPSAADRKNLKRGASVQVIVYHYNPWQYQVVLNHQDSSILAPQGDKILPFLLDPSNLAAVAGKILSTGGAVREVADTTAAFEQLKGTYELRGWAYKNKGMELMDEHHVKQTISPERLKKERDSLLTLSRARVAIEEGKKKVKELRDGIFNLKKNTENNLYQLTKLSSFLYDPSPDCEKFTKKNIENLIGQVETTYSTVRDQIGAVKGTVQDGRDYYLGKDGFAPYIDFSKTNGELKLADSLIRQFYTFTDQFFVKADSLAGYPQQQKLVTQLTPLQELSTCYRSVPLFFTADNKKISIQVLPWKDSTARLPSYQTNFELPWQQQHTWGISSGIYCSTMHNNTYGLLSSVVGTDTVYNIVKDKTGQVEFGISALAYTAWNISSDNGYPKWMGIGFGGGFSFETNPKPRVMLGLSYVAGDRNRLCITLGGVAGYSQRLSSAYDGATNFPKPQTSYTKDALCGGMFLSFSYSFLSGN